MSLATIDQQLSQPSDEEHDHLSALLTRKLRNIPANHLPFLQLSDVLQQTPSALHLPNIPCDLQLVFFLRHRAVIDRFNGKPLKNSEIQSPDITRAIWYYRLDATHQFQRYHDTARWNIALFAALLTDMAGGGPTTTTTPTPPTQRHHHRQPTQPRQKDSYKSIPPAAQRFMTSYLRAVMEHHNTPQHFSARESFLHLWKEGVWDVFSLFSAGQKRMLKGEMKALMKEWERELEYAMSGMGRAEYEKKVGRFVGSVVPERREQGRATGGLRTAGTELLLQQVMKKKVTEEGIEAAGKGTKIDEGGSEARNELLEALRVPLSEQGEDVPVEGGSTVTDLHYAIGIVRKVRPRNILPVLMRLFPPEDST